MFAVLPSNLRDSVLQQTQVPPPEQLVRVPDVLKLPSLHALFPSIVQSSVLKVNKYSRFVSTDQGRLLWPALQLVPELTAIEITGFKSCSDFCTMVKGVGHVKAWHATVILRTHA